MDPRDTDILAQFDSLLSSPQQSWLFGAGISLGAKVPLMWPLTDRVLALAKDHSEDDFAAIQFIKSQLEADSHIEHILSQIGDMHAIAERSKEKTTVLGSVNLDLAELEQFHKRIADWIAETIRWGYCPKGEGTDEEIGSLNNPIVVLDGHRKFVSALFKERQKGVSERRRSVRMFTTNYDTLLEDALALECLDYWDGFAGGAVAFRKFRFGEKEPNDGAKAHIIKLHGSIDWYLGEDGLVWRIRDGDLYPEKESRVLIYPQSTKYVATQRDPFAAQFDLLRRALAAQEENVFATCGYSFGDEHINQEIEIAMRQPSSKTTLIAFSSEPNEQLNKWREEAWGNRIYVVSKSGLFVGTQGPFAKPTPPADRKLVDVRGGGHAASIRPGGLYLMGTVFQHVEDLKVGHIVEVSGCSIRVELSGDVTELTRTYDGRVYPIGQIGSIVKVHFGRRLIFGFVTLLRMRSEEQPELAVPIPPDADQRIMQVELFAEGHWTTSTKSLQFVRGVTTYPLPRQNVHLITRAEALAIYAAAEGERPNSGVCPLVPFGHYVGADNAVCRANIDKMLGMHCAVLGSTGAGKSAAVSALLHSMLRHKPAEGAVSHPRIVLIDPHGEYGRAFKERGLVYRAYDPLGTEEATGQPICLPYWLMTADEFRMLAIGKTEKEATSQNNIIYKALTHARMVTAGLVEPAPVQHGGNAPPGDDEPDVPRPKAGVEPARVAEFDRDRPLPFSLDELQNHIRFLQAARKKDGRLESIPPSDFTSKFKSILDKLSVLRRDPRIQFLMKEWTRESIRLEAVIQQLVGQARDEHRDIRILDISGLPNEVAGPLAAMLARLLFQYKIYQTVEERRRDPVVLVCEEAHRYVPDRGLAEYAAAQSAIRRIAREGRKYGIGLMLVSQRPSDVESTVIAQCGTWLVLRLTNAGDQQHVARFLPDGLSGMTKALPNLGQQEAIFVGEGAAMPARIRIRDLNDEELPRSDTAKFAEGWTQPRLSASDLKNIAERMAGNVVAELGEEPPPF